MIKINEKEYEINFDIKWGTQKLMGKILEDSKNPKNQRYMELVMKDLLIPSPSATDMFHFRMSDIEKVFSEYAKDTKKTDVNFKKKRSQ